MSLIKKIRPEDTFLFDGILIKNIGPKNCLLMLDAVPTRKLVDSILDFPRAVGWMVFHNDKWKIIHREDINAPKTADLFQCIALPINPPKEN